MAPIPSYRRSQLAVSALPFRPDFSLVGTGLRRFLVPSAYSLSPRSTFSRFDFMFLRRWVDTVVLYSRGPRPRGSTPEHPTSVSSLDLPPPQRPASFPRRLTTRTPRESTSTLLRRLVVPPLLHSFFPMADGCFVCCLRESGSHSHTCRFRLLPPPPPPPVVSEVHLIFSFSFPRLSRPFLFPLLS